MVSGASVSLKIHWTILENWNLPDLMREAADWIGENEIDVSDMVFNWFDDPENEVSSVVWKVTVYYWSVE